ncbi:Ribosomal 50S subunit-recycling heat shock protein, contains S4 domain [Anaerosphaera aminiphila DSM 21120]|uniref:RQC P-site tRNA stabilizing factor n=1 Tax=Anaerosphaera aminiphila DSM 21120 TaxID=1120995 RepID=A0A1M5R202_9FIRM|nr:RNA-binding S4 domain-containing protein [Anaerosphaera aminiphila]SHH20029.1 Ribosomal 50S subunit-recycling heat shock protein, contains S4 domain [Anaerosphaera aminiphila DSM 21120]
MRVDKFLKVSRIIVRRTVAKEASEAGRVKINSKVVKPSDEVKIGDILEIDFGNRAFKAKVLEVRENVNKSEATSLYEILE